MSNLPIPAGVLNQHIVLLAKTRAGKSSVMRVMAEHILDEKKPICIIDPKGDWWGIKSSADGKKAGYPVVIFGGDHADVPINEHAGAHVAELVATGNRPCLIDLGGWMPGARTRFWVDFASTLFRLTRGNRWLFIDEVHNFAPKGRVFDPESGKGLHWANRLASEGLGKGIHLVIASQRPQKVHNDTLTSCETLCALKVLHSSDREAVTEWIRGCGDPTKAKEMLESLSKLKRGEGWFWSPEIEFGPERVQFPMFKTYDSFKPQNNEKPATLKGWASVDLDEVRAKFSTVIEEAKAKDPVELQKRVAQLTAELAKKIPVPVGFTTNATAGIKAINEADRAGYMRGLATGEAEGLRIGKKHAERFTHSKIVGPLSRIENTPFKGVQVIVDGAREAADQMIVEWPKGSGAPTPDAPTPRQAMPTIHQPAHSGLPSLQSHDGGTALTSALRRVINAIGWWHKVGKHPVERDRAAVVAGYSPNASTFGVYIAELVKRGVVFTEPGKVGLTPAGFRLAVVPVATTAEELRKMARDLLKPQEQRVFDVVYGAYPNEILRDDVATAVGLSPNASTAGVYIAAVSAYGIIEPAGRGCVKAAGWLFP